MSASDVYHLALELQKHRDTFKHVTSAERPPIRRIPGAKPELLVPASVVFQKPRPRVDLRDWICVPGANWRHPEGPVSSLKGRAKHPVVHVAYEDAEAYAKWCGKELLTEAEWEFAARGGVDGAEFVSGAAFKPDGKHQANTWQGELPKGVIYGATGRYIDRPFRLPLHRTGERRVTNDHRERIQ